MVGLTDLDCGFDPDVVKGNPEKGTRGFWADDAEVIRNDILDFSKIEARKLELDPIPSDLAASLDETVRSLAPRAHQKGLEVAYHLPALVPCSLVGDPSRMRQIIVNLIGNAIKFTETGEVILRVECESLSSDTAVLHFAVIDTGMGVPAEKQAAIFEAFSQVDASTTRHFGGTGLGLAITTQLIALMAGRIWLESKPGSGSKFHFTLPFGQTVPNVSCDQSLLARFEEEP